MPRQADFHIIHMGPWSHPDLVCHRARCGRFKPVLAHPAKTQGTQFFGTDTASSRARCPATAACSARVWSSSQYRALLNAVKASSWPGTNPRSQKTGPSLSSSSRLVTTWGASSYPKDSINTLSYFILSSSMPQDPGGSHR